MAKLKKILIVAVLLAIISTVGFVLFTKLKVGQKNGPNLTNPKFELVESSPENYDSSFTVKGQPTFVFSKKIALTAEELPNYFAISPAIQGTWHKDKNNQVVYFAPTTSLAFNTIYTVKINKNLTSSDNFTLPDDLNIKFKTAQNPDFNFMSDKKLAIISPNDTLDIPLSNTSYGDHPQGKLFAASDVVILVQKSDEHSLLQYFAISDKSFPLYGFNGTPSPQKTIPTKIMQGQTQGSGLITVDGANFSTPGIYYVVIQTSFGYDDLFVNVTNHINQVFADSTSRNVWVTNKSGQSLANSDVFFYSVKNQPSLEEKLTTATDGLVKSSKSLKDVNFVISHIKDDTAISFVGNYSPYGNYLGQDNFRVYSYSDRPIYRPGDTLHYKAVIRTKTDSGFSIPSGKFYWRLSTNYTTTDESNYKLVNIDSNGTVNFDLTIPKSSSDLNPQIILSTKNSDGTYRAIDTFVVNIESYRKPDMDINTTTQEKEYISSDTAHFTVNAKTNYGSPLANINFTYRVLVNDFYEVKDRTTENVDSSASGLYGAGNELLTGTGKFDDKGNAQITFDTTLPKKYELSQIATLEITPNIGVAPSIGKIAKLIHRGEFAVFIDNLSGDTKNGIHGTVTILDHNSPRQPIVNKTLKVSLYSVTNYNTKVFVSSQDITSDQSGAASFTFPNVNNGSYEVVAQADDTRNNTVTGRQSLYVGFSGQFNNTKPKYTLSITAQKDKYSVGDTANFDISADFPLADSAIALSTGSGYPPKIVSLFKNTQGTIQVPIKEDYTDGVGVDIYTVINGTVVYGHTAVEIIKPSKEIKTTISFDKNAYQPGDSVTATLKTLDINGTPVSADNSLSVIDASILQIGQLNGDIYQTFYPTNNFNAYLYVQHFDSTVGISRQEGGGGGGCFLAGTQIQMADNTTKNIEDVKIGDQILTKLSDSSNILVSDTVTNTIHHNVTDYLTINGNLNITWIHRIYLNGKWQQASDAKIGDILVGLDGKKVKIVSIVPHLGNFSVYNLTTSHLHTFFASGIYVHNEKGEGPRENFVDTAYWNAHIKTDSNGNASVKFKLPDNLTTFTAQVVSNSLDSKFGQTTSSVASHKDFNIIPAFSNFYYEGDEPDVQALFQNLSGKDINTNLTLTLKETGQTTGQSLFVKDGDFAVATFPIKIPSSQGLTLDITAKDNTGKVLDSLSVKRSILPKGNINSSWYSYTGNKNYTYQTTYPTLDFNKLDLIVAPNIITTIFGNNIYFSQTISTQTGQNLYVYSELLKATKDGLISPTAYKYAHLKNNLRGSVDFLLANRTNDHWETPSYSNDSFVSMNLWLADGLDQANSSGTLDGFSNVQSVIKETKDRIVNNNTNSSDLYSPEDRMARLWVLGINSDNKNFNDSAESIAVNAIQKDQTLISKLRIMALSSASDRFIWDGESKYSTIFPALALIEKGTANDADKAIKGLSFVYRESYYETSPLALLAGIKYAQRNNLFIDKPSLNITVNGENVFHSTKDTNIFSFTGSFPAKNTVDGKISANIQVDGDLPIYSTFVQTDYNKSPNNTNLGDAKAIDTNLSESFKDISSGQDVQSINQGQSGMVVYTSNNPFNPSDNNSRNGFTYANSLVLPVSPAFMFLNQGGTFGNTPQYQSAISKIYPTGTSNVIQPSNYSDQAAFFTSSSLTKGGMVYPFVIYNISRGNFYQPKTSLVFPNLGLISPQK